MIVTYRTKRNSNLEEYYKIFNENTFSFLEMFSRKRCFDRIKVFICKGLSVFVRYCLVIFDKRLLKDGRKEIT